MTPLNIPTHWSAEEALTIVNFLQQLIDAIWQVHGVRMGQHLRELYDSMEDYAPPPPLDDDVFPF